MPECSKQGSRGVERRGKKGPADLEPSSAANEDLATVGSILGGHQCLDAPHCPTPPFTPDHPPFFSSSPVELVLSLFSHFSPLLSRQSDSFCLAAACPLPTLSLRLPFLHLSSLDLLLFPPLHLAASSALRFPLFSFPLPPFSSPLSVSLSLASLVALPLNSVASPSQIPLAIAHHVATHDSHE